MVCLESFGSIKTSREFSRVYKEGKKWHCDGAVIFYLPIEGKKVGFIASKKTGNAVLRNRCKRRMRALFYELKYNIKDGYYVFVAKSSLNKISYDKFKKSVQWALKKMECQV